MKLTDPGAGLPRAQAREARKAAWKRPTLRAEREKLRDERIAAARERDTKAKAEREAMQRDHHIQDTPNR
jgi:vacuolar-type H+-ATPase subunit I/STV1